MAIESKSTQERRTEALRTLLQDRYGNYYGALHQAWDLIQDHSGSIQDPPSTDEELLAALTLVDVVRDQVKEAEAGLLAQLRQPDDQGRAPVEWERIGDALGMSRQGAERRYLRSQTSGVRDANRARGDVHRSRRDREQADQRAIARWGRCGRADRDWHLDLRVRTASGQEAIARLDGFGGATVRLDSMCRVDGGFVSWRDLQLLEVVEETTPWADAEAPGTLTGLATQE
ncbi:hypothetical protein [Nocardiopsis sp. L17-MgMaSL7]|uniref:hypothetical protein n=1 Tax=Nocardiopsis sp. L17-MgMaSL7 TaxID=1938893 RepID=UPI000D70C408|nr:hypothetical protein [Nocardiopsis sp. L17-MgMaSL7]PWV44587.1 hypothetical protein BDW27_12346 [Nocardiopsis sp. L17-MgMaSL7]